MENRVGLGVRPVRKFRNVVKDVSASYKQILQAIVIKVRHSVGPAGHLQSRAREAAPARDIDKNTVAAILEQGKSLQFSSRVPDVRQAVIVQIAKLRAHP